MPVERTRSSGRGRAPRRGLSRILALLLACGTTFGGTTFGGIGEAAAFEIFGFKLWGSSEQEDADIVDPLRYAVTIETPDADADLKKKLEAASTLKADEDRPVSGSLGLLTVPLSAFHMDGALFETLTGYVKGIVTLDGGAAALMVGVPLTYKLHILLGFTLFLVSPFTRMIHIWSGAGALSYLFRPYQIVRTPKTRAEEPTRP